MPALCFGSPTATTIADGRASERSVSKGVTEGRRKVVLQADGAVPHGEVIALIGEISRREGGATIHVGVQEPQ